MTKKRSLIKKEINELEKWIIQRRKFFIKLSWVIGLIAALLIISHIYLRVNGIGL